MAKSWTIVGKDLLSVVSCKEPYEWRQGTDAEWEFEPKVKNGAAKGNQFHVSGECAQKGGWHSMRHAAPRRRGKGQRGQQDKAATQGIRP
jgi:hypothetical protein